MFVEERGGPEASQGSSLSPSPSPGLLFPAEASKRVPSAARDRRQPCQWQRPKPQIQAGHWESRQRESTEESVFSREGGACRSPGSTGLPLATAWIHLSVEWRVPVCSLSWLLVYTALGTLLRSMGRGRTMCSKDKYSGRRGRYSPLPSACQGLQHSPSPPCPRV